MLKTAPGKTPSVESCFGGAGGIEGVKPVQKDVVPAIEIEELSRFKFKEDLLK